MAKLIFLLDGNVIKEYILDRERMTIGRRPNNDIHIDNLAISGEHAVIITAGQEVFIQDMNSTNGTLVNKKPVTKQALSHGDVIDLGKYSLKFVKDGQAAMVPSDGFADTVMVAPQQSQSPNPESNTPEDLSAEHDSSETDVKVNVEDESAVRDEVISTEVIEDVADNQGQPPRLNILNGDDAGSELMLDKSMVKIGEPGQQVAVITKRKDGYYITHVSGDNYPSINGATIGAQAIPLKNHDVIEILAVKMEVRLD